MCSRVLPSINFRVADKDDQGKGKGQEQKHSDFKATLVQRVVTTFQLPSPDQAWLDTCCGGGSRQLVAAHCGMPAVGMDLRPEVVAECRELARRAGLSGKCFFVAGDMREAGKVLEETAHSDPRFRDLIKGGFGGLFSSIPFWHLEHYDDGVGDGGAACSGGGAAAAPAAAAAAAIAAVAAAPAAPAAGIAAAASASGPKKKTKSKRHPKLLEHCGPEFGAFVSALGESLSSAVGALAPAAWVLIHCGPVRHRGVLCDIVRVMPAFSDICFSFCLCRKADKTVILMNVHHSLVILIAWQPYEVKRLLKNMGNVEVMDEVVITRPLGSAPMRMGNAGVYAKKSQVRSPSF